MAETIVTLSGDERALLDALRKVTRGQDDVDAGFKKAKKSSEEAAKQAEADAKRIAKTFETQTTQLRLQLIEMKKGPAVTAELKALMQGLTKEQALQIRQLHEKVALEEKSAKANVSGIDSVVTSAAKWTAGYLSVSTASQAILATLEKIDLRQTKLVENTLSLAKAQNDAAKNLATIDLASLDDILQNKVPEIMVRSRFSDPDLISKALGSVSSITSPEQAPGIVELAAKIERLNPENLLTTATSLSDLVKATGSNDPRKEMSQLISSGTTARPEELPLLALGSASVSNVATVMSPRTPATEASKQSTALFSALTKVDPKGQAATTAAINFMEQVRTSFKGDPNDPDSFVGRLQTIQQSPERKGEVLKNLTGEAKFKPLFEGLLDPNSKVFREFTAALKATTTNVEVFDNLLVKLAASPQQKVANAIARTNTAIAVSDMKQQTSIDMKAISVITQDAIAATASGFIDNLTLGAFSGIEDNIERSLYSPEFYAKNKINELRNRRSRIISTQAPGPERDARVFGVDEAIESIREIISTQNPQIAEQNKLLAENNRQIEKLNARLGGQAQPNSPPPAIVPINSERNAVEANRP